MRLLRAAGATTSSPLLLAHSGTSIPDVVTSTGGSVLVRFTSNTSVKLDGFEATYTSGNSTDVYAPMAAMGISVFPNPASEQVYVDLGDHSEALARLYDVAGRQVTTATRIFASQSMVSLRDIDPGVYVLILDIEGQRVATRLIVN